VFYAFTTTCSEYLSTAETETLTVSVSIEKNRSVQASAFSTVNVL